MGELKKIREDAGVTQEAVALRMGVCRQDIGRIESGKVARADTVRRYKDAVRAAARERRRLLRAIAKVTGCDAGDFANRKIGDAGGR